MRRLNEQQEINDLFNSGKKKEKTYEVLNAEFKKTMEMNAEIELKGD